MTEISSPMYAGLGLIGWFIVIFGAIYVWDLIKKNNKNQNKDDKTDDH